jgi:threonine synthase
VTTLCSRLVCAGCGTAAPEADPYPFRCPSAALADDVDHVFRRELDLARVAFPADDEPHPYVRYRGLLHAYRVATAGGVSDDAFVELVRSLDARVAEVDGRGFAATPFARSAELSDALGFSARGGVWVKDETGNVSGSHKARHLFGVLLWLEVVELLGRADPTSRRRLAIASCGNAALAAAVVAKAGDRELDVFVPPDADPVVLGRLEELGAHVTGCPRDGLPGDPAYRRLLRALDEGAVPFTCQGNLNGLAVEGGQTLGWEIAGSGEHVDRVVVQVGGGALAGSSTTRPTTGSRSSRGCSRRVGKRSWSTSRLSGRRTSSPSRRRGSVSTTRARPGSRGFSSCARPEMSATTSASPCCSQEPCERLRRKGE